MKRHRVAFIIDEYQPGAGTENQLRGIVSHLDRVRCDPLLITLTGNPQDPALAELNCDVIVLGVPKLRSMNGLRSFARLGWLLRTRAIDVALIFFPTAQVYAAPACRLAGVKACIVCRRDLGYWYSPTWLRMIRFIRPCVDYYLVNANAIKRRVAEHEGFPSERILVLPNILWNLSEYLSAEATHPPLPEGFTSEPLVGLLANLRLVKRVDRFLAVADLLTKEVPAVRFLIIGEGVLREDLAREAALRDLSGRVHFVGNVANVSSYLSRFTVGLLTSESEGLSNALIEYAAAGVPAVAFDVGGNKEVIQDSRTGFLAPDGDVHAMADRVRHLLLTPGLRRKMSIAARQYAVAQFSPERNMEALEAFLTDAATHPRRSLRFDRGPTMSTSSRRPDFLVGK